VTVLCFQILVPNASVLWFQAVSRPGGPVVEGRGMVMSHGISKMEALKIGPWPSARSSAWS